MTRLVLGRSRPEMLALPAGPDRLTVRVCRLVAVSVLVALAAGALSAVPGDAVTAAVKSAGRAGARSADAAVPRPRDRTGGRHRAAGRRAPALEGPSLTVGDGSRFTRSRAVRVVISIPDPDATDREYELVEDGVFTGSWTAWPGGSAVEAPFTLSEGEGRKSIDLRYRSSTGGIRLSAAVVLDTTPPSVVVLAEGGDSVTRDRSIRLDIGATDASPLRNMTISTDGGQTWRHRQPFARELLVDLPAGTPVGRVKVLVRVRDAAGNVGRDGDGVRFQPPRFSTMALRLRYALAAELDYRRGLLAVDETITLENRLNRLVTHVDLYLMPRAFGELRSGPRVTIGGELAESRWTNNANLRVRLAAPLAKGERTQVRLRFGLRANSSIGTSLESRLARANGLMTVGHWYATVGAGYPARYPGDALVSPVADRVVLELTHDRGLVVAAPGRLTDSTRTSKRYVHAPARDLAFAVSPGYQRRAGGAAGVRVEVYALSGMRADAALASARLALRRFSAALGPYPWSRLVIAESPWPAHGTEYSGFLMIGVTNLTDRLLVAHEVAHEWFQALVGNDQFAAPWVDESVTEFLSRLYFAKKARYCSSRPIDTTIFDYPDIEMLTLAEECGSYYQTVYLKGQAMYWGLRTRMGGATLLRALRAVVAEHAWDLLSTAELRRALLRHGAPRRYLDGFLRGW